MTFKLSDTNEFIKKNLNKFIDGDFNHQFDDEHIEFCIRLGFLFNHIKISPYEIRFKYNETSSVSRWYDESHVTEESIISTLINGKGFKKELITYIRDYKLNKIFE